MARFRVVAVTATALVAVVVTLSAGSLLSPVPRQAVNDFGQLAGGTAAAVAALWTARRRSGVDRLWRVLLGVGMSSWSIAQAIWTWDQVIRGIPVPDSVPANVGYLLMPVLACAAIATFPTGRPRDGEPVPGRAAFGDATFGGARRALVAALDSVVFAGTAALLSWTTTLHTAVAVHDPNPVRFSIALAQPIMDVVLVTLVLIVAMETRTGREFTLFLLALGLISLAVSDSAYTYLVSTGGDRYTPVSDAGFVVGPVLIALGVLAPATRALRRPRWLWWVKMATPYLPIMLVAFSFLVAYLCGHTFTKLEVFGGVGVVALGGIRQFVLLAENLSLLQQLDDSQEELRHQAFHDTLTGLPNRGLFQNRLDHAVELNRRDLRPLALLFLDLDDLKTVNDTLGHAAGDELLRAVAERLRGCVRSADTLARLGGDEFAVLLESDLELPESVGDRILSAVRQPITLAGRPHRTTISIGLVVADPADDAVSATELLRRADRAMYAAKGQGKGFMVAYTGATDSPADEDRMTVMVTRELRHDPNAIDLEMDFAPIVRLADGQPIAVEASARWSHAGWGNLSPAVIMRIAHHDEVGRALGDRILARACTQVLALRAGPYPDLAVHVNVSAERLVDDRLYDAVLAALERYGLPGEALLLEVAEPDRILDADTTRPAMTRLHRLGVRLVLDGLGTPFASLSSVHQLPFDMVKLGPTLTRSAIIEKRRGTAVRAAVIALANELRMTVIADGVRTSAQAGELAAGGCQFGQGSYLDDTFLDGVGISAAARS